MSRVSSLCILSFLFSPLLSGLGMGKPETERRLGGGFSLPSMADYDEDGVICQIKSLSLMKIGTAAGVTPFFRRVKLKLC